MEIEDWREFERTDVLGDGWERGMPLPSMVDGTNWYDVDRAMIESDPCPQCGGPITFKPYRPDRTNPYTRNRSSQYRAFGVCKACNTATEY